MADFSGLQTYWKVFAALAVLTVVEVFVAMAPGGAGLVALTLVALAVSKAALVALYYMHLRYDRRLLTYIAVSPFFLSAILIVALLTDSTLNPR